MVFGRRRLDGAFTLAATKPGACDRLAAPLLLPEVKPASRRGSPTARRAFYCRSYSPLPRRFRTVNPAFLASEMETGFNLIGELKVEITFRTGFLQAGHRLSSGALKGRRRVNFPPQTAQFPSHSSYS